MRRIAGVLLVSIAMLLPVATFAQTGKLNLNFSDLEAKAEETVDVNLDGQMLRLAAKFLSSDPDEKAVREVVSGLSGIYVRSYEFRSAGAYSLADVERVRGQLGGNWQRIVTVRSKTQENVDIYVVPAGNTTHGIVIIAAEPRELTIVQLVGTIDLDRLSSIEGQFGIPEVTVTAKREKKGQK